MESLKLQLLFLLMYVAVLPARSCNNCGVGTCVGKKCVCPSGFWGSKCQYGRKRLTKTSGFIMEGKKSYLPGSKMIWIIESLRRNSSIQLKLDSLSTECAWDYLYIYDGRSIYDPQIAALSGSMNVHSNHSSKRKLEARSGSALIHFYADRHLEEEGFTLSYSISDCNNETCSNHGFCNSRHQCECNKGWTGRNCSTKVCCPGETYDIGKNTYNCPASFYDANCPIEVSSRASHASALQNTDIWSYGGYSFKTGLAADLVKYDTVKKTWQIVSANPDPKPRYGHSMVYYNKKLFVFGGVVNSASNNELWEFDILTKTWKMVNSSNGKQPVAVTGHAAVAVANKMYVFMGYREDNSFYSGVQQFDMDTYEWSIVDSKGALMLGLFGHSAVYDVISDVVFVYGGWSHSIGSRGQLKRVSHRLYTFSPTTKTWTIMPGSNHPRMLHSAVIIGRLVIIYGGTILDHSTMDNRKRCYSNDVLAYDIVCKKWNKVDAGNLLELKGRFGHTATAINRTAYIIGGFNGVFHNDVIPVTLGHCSGYTNKAACLQAPVIVNCVWDKVLLRCLDAEKASVVPSSQIETAPCNATTIKCQSFGTCENCLSNTISCAWCKNSCQDPTCNNDSKLNPVTDTRSCPASSSLIEVCKSLSTCAGCESHPNCTWLPNIPATQCSFTAYKMKTNASEKCKPHNPGKAHCYKMNTCSECTRSVPLGCMWCESQKKCIGRDAYFVNFPYGQCMEVTNSQTCSKLVCSQQKTCQDCFQLPGCGWCEHALKTGVGQCMDGGDRGPKSVNNTLTCPAASWHFTQCPLCQCNGHSKCVNGSVCKNCMNNTTGPHCQFCKNLYFGNALNNGTCRACYCNDHANTCDAATGKCECNTSGVTGFHCERCEPKYNGNASSGGHCFYPLPVGFAFSFNKTNKNINFEARPKNDRDDLRFEIKVKGNKHGHMAFSLTRNGHESFVVKDFLLGSYERSFPAEKYKFVAQKSPLFRVYLYNWSKNTEYTISFHHKPVQLNWLHFLIVFLICFCSLLIILIVIWKLKQQYSNYQFDRRRRHELREMASRPCGHVSLVCDGTIKRDRKVEPSQIALESFQRGNAAVASILVELPRTSEGFTPKGQGGLCIGSTLINHRNQRIYLNAQQQLCIFRGRRKNYRQTPVNA